MDVTILTQLSAALSRLVLVALAATQLAACGSTAGDQANVPRSILEVQQWVEEIEKGQPPLPGTPTNLSAEFPHLAVEGQLLDGQPISLSSTYSRARLVRDESYFFRYGALIMVRARQSWDVDDPVDAPAPTTTVSYFLPSGEVAGRRVEREGTPAEFHATGLPANAAEVLRTRAAQLTALLGGSPLGEAEAEALESFPLAADFP